MRFECRSATSGAKLIQVVTGRMLRRSPSMVAERDLKGIEQAVQRAS
jgi:hypothetical protein